MAKCSSNCRGGCHDHSSKAEQSPSVVDLLVVRQILLKAFINMSRRHVSIRQGELSADDVFAKDEYLAQWLGDTFCGLNPHFDVGPEDWNPHGMAQYLRETLAHMRDDFPEDDAEVVYLVTELFKDQAVQAVEDCIQMGELLEYPEQIPPKVDRFLDAWSMLFTGAPVESINSLVQSNE